MYWGDYDHLFCENKILNTHEYINSITSIFILLFGLYGVSSSNNIILDIIYSIISIISIGSIGYHYTGNIGFALLDEIPMIISIFIGLIFIDTLYYKIKNNDFIRKIKLLIFLFIMIIFIIFNIMSNFRLIFPYIFLSCIIIFLLNLYNLIIILPSEISVQIYKKYIYSVFFLITSMLFWGITEIFCTKLYIPFALLGHPLWHLFVGYSFYNIVQIIYFIKLFLYSNHNYKIYYNYIYLLKIKLVK